MSAEASVRRSAGPSDVVMAASGLSKAFGGQVVLDSVSAELRRGEVVLLRGANGSGKTTLLNLFTGNLEPDSGEVRFFTEEASEQFKFPRPWWRDLMPFDHFTPERLAQEGVGRTWQEVRLFQHLTLQDNIVSATLRPIGENPFLVFLRWSEVRRQTATVRTAADARLADLGLQGREYSSADRVSLGQSKRVAIARAIHAGAKMLFLDEPLGGLDSSGIAEVMGLLRQLVHEHRITLVVIEHVFNIPFILDLATTIWTLRDGNLEAEPASDIASDPADEQNREAPDWLGDVSLGGRAVESRALPGGATWSVAVRKPAAPDRVLEMDDLVVRRGYRPVIGRARAQGGYDGLSLSINNGDVAVLQAPNGWGKTTLLDAIAGLIPVQQGTIRLCGEPVDGYPAWQRAQRGLAVLQSRENFFPNLTTREALRLSSVDDHPENLQPFLKRRIADLSGGERQMVAITCSFPRGYARLWLLDEPFGMLDRSGIEQVKAAIERFTGSILILVPSSAM